MLDLALKLMGLVAIPAGLFAIYTYYDTRGREFALKRTELLLAQGRLLDEDPVMSEALSVLDGRHAYFNVRDIFDAGSNISRTDRDRMMAAFDKLLNFFERIHHVTFRTKGLTLGEAVNFAWYLGKITSCKELKEYCQESYYDVLELAGKVEKYEKTAK